VGLEDCFEEGLMVKPVGCVIVDPLGFMIEPRLMIELPSNEVELAVESRSLAVAI